MRRTFEVAAEPRGRTYTDLLYRSFPWCAELLLVVVLLPGGDDPLLPSAHSVLRALEPHLGSVDDASEWPGTRLDGGATGRVHRYRLHPEVIDVVAAATDRLFAWRHPELPQDLALVRGDGTPFLATVASEDWAALTLEEGERQILVSDLPELGLRDLWS